MHYWKYNISTTPEIAEILPALLADAPFDTFEDASDGLAAYMPAAEGNEQDAESLLAELADSFAFTWSKEFIEGQNWNELWESNFQPVVVNDFCAVRADFHAPIEGVRHELVINPKMAFGTGHHETTWQCMAALEHLPVQGTSLLDYGCGTGILAILAARLGAAHIEAVDIEEESYLNTLENARLNNTPQVEARQGTLESVQGRDFDGILANINRNVITASLPGLSQLLKPGGWLLVSGILAEDDALVTETAQKSGFQKEKMTQRGNWLCVKYIKK
jgi:ribosomal protein L11 methyltransferase